VVFSTEAELKRHFTNAHGSELRMSRTQRREALSLPINLQFRTASTGQCTCMLVCTLCQKCHCVCILFTLHLGVVLH
jgi:hypothetical protein